MTAKQASLGVVEQYVIELPYPPSANVYWRHRGMMVGGKPKALVYIGEQGKAYRKTVTDIITEQFNGRPPMLRCDLAIGVRQFPATAQDIDNCIKPLLDSLQHAGMYANDRQVCELLVIRDRRAAVGRIRVTITAIGA